MRFLYSNPNPGGTPHFSSPSSSSSAAPPQPLAVDSDVVVILAALLCALICVVGLALVARCAWLRRSTGAAGSLPPPAANKGLKKKALRALPKLSFDSAAHVKLVECPICLAEFANGDEVRILPHCGHGFHAGCVDTWLGSHSSCPFCRQVLVVAPPPAALPAGVRCQKCGASSASAGGDVNRFLP